MYPTLLPGKHNQSACVLAHSARPRRNLLRNRVLPLAGHNLFTPVPIPVLEGVLGVKGFVLERLQTKVMGKAVCNVMPGFTGAMIRGLWRNQDLLAYSVQSKGTLNCRDDFSLTRAPNFCWTHPQRVLSSSSSLHAGPDKVRIDRSTAPS